jgi:excisionase family DNA binding protein
MTIWTSQSSTHDRLLKTSEVAALLGLSSEAVLRRWRRGELPGFRLSSKALRFRESEVNAWLESRRHLPRSKAPEAQRFVGVERDAR